MARILSIDYGTKRTGLAVTDPGQIIATGLTTIETPKIFNFLKNYVVEEDVATFVLGEAKNLDNSPAESAKHIANFKQKLQQLFPSIQIIDIDERFTSKMALQSMIDSNVKKKDRRNKALIDEVSATIILQSYLEQIK